jgi:hypothetical protein
VTRDVDLRSVSQTAIKEGETFLYSDAEGNLDDRKDLPRVLRCCGCCRAWTALARKGAAPGHAIRTAYICVRLAGERGLSESDRSALLYAGLLRDESSAQRVGVARP